MTQAINRKTLDLFQKNCQRAAQLLSSGAPLDDLVVTPRHSRKKQPRLPKTANAPDANLQTNSSLSASEVHELHPDVISNNNYAVLTPEMRRLYPGAVALGPKERISSVAELDQLCVDDELDVQEEEPEDPPLDSIPEYLDRTLPEFEEEGFGLKKKVVL